MSAHPLAIPLLLPAATVGSAVSMADPAVLGGALLVLAILAGIVHDDSRGSYMAMESMMYNTALLLSSFMLTASAVIPAAGMSTLFILLGAVGFISYRLCLPLKKSRQAYAS